MERPALVLILAALAGCRSLTVDCRSEPDCPREGKCTKTFLHAGESGYRCYAASKADCEHSAACHVDGRCALNGDGTCVRPEDAVDPAKFCATSEWCLLSGACGPVDGDCEAASERDCARSIACRTIGACHLDRDWCRPRSDADCKASLECKAFGRCEVRDGTCTARGKKPPYPGYCLGAGAGCADQGRCLQTPDARCITPAEAGLPDTLPRLAPKQTVTAPEPPPAPPDAPPPPAHREVKIVCSGKPMHAVVPAGWRDDKAGDGCQRWRVADDTWVTARCAPAQRLGLPELDAWYDAFRNADSSALADVGTGHASIGDTCGHRMIGIHVDATLVKTLACVPVAPPKPGVHLEREAIETDRALFVLDLVGAHADDEAAGADFAAFTYSLRERAGVPGDSYDRSCP